MIRADPRKGAGVVWGLGAWLSFPQRVSAPLPGLHRGDFVSFATFLLRFPGQSLSQIAVIEQAHGKGKSLWSQVAKR